MNLIDGEFVDKNGNKKKRQPCQVYTRVMGYLRPVSAYNIGKKSEFYSRKVFTEQAVANSKFKERFSTPTKEE